MQVLQSNAASTQLPLSLVLLNLTEFQQITCIQFLDLTNKKVALDNLGSREKSPFQVTLLTAPVSSELPFCQPLSSENSLFLQYYSIDRKAVKRAVLCIVLAIEG